MDSSTYGSMVERGGYATGGIVGECGPELVWVNRGEYVSPTTGIGATYALMTMRIRPGGLDPVAETSWLEPPGDPDDGCAGVPARV